MFENQVWVCSQLARLMNLQGETLEIMYCIFRSCTFSQMIDLVIAKKSEDDNSGFNIEENHPLMEKVRNFLARDAEETKVQLSQMRNKLKNLEKKQVKTKKDLDDMKAKKSKTDLADSARELASKER